jgi:hypothetical protein
VQYFEHDHTVRFENHKKPLQCELGAIARESKNDNPIDTFTFDTSTQALDQFPS